MAAKPFAWVDIPIAFEFELSGGTWTDVSIDILQSPPPKWKRGASGASFFDLIPSPLAFTFALRNDDGNSAKKEGLYSPAHANLRAGFELGMRIRIRIPRVKTAGSDRTYVYYLKRIQPQSGSWGPRKVLCVATDWIDKAMRTRIPGLGVQTDITDQALYLAIRAAIPGNKPESSNSTSTNDTFPFANENQSDQKQTILDAFRKLTQSGFSQVVFGGFTAANDAIFPGSAGEFMSWISRSDRDSFSFGGPANFDDDQSALELIYNAEDLINVVNVTNPIRKVDPDAATVLYSLDSQRPVIPAGGSITLTLEYRDPANEAQAVSATDMVTPEVQTDFQMNAKEDGTGLDLSPDHTVTPDFQASSVELVIANTGPVNSYFTKMDGRGRGLYSYGTAHFKATDTASVAAHGERQRTVSLPWQSNPNVTEQAAKWLLTKLGDEAAPSLQGARLMYVANRHEDLADLAWGNSPGSIIHLAEPVTGLAVSANYFWQIQNIEYQYLEDTRLQVTYLLKFMATDTSFWKLGATANDELGTDTKLGYF